MNQRVSAIEAVSPREFEEKCARNLSDGMVLASAATGFDSDAGCPVFTAIFADAVSGASLPGGGGAR